MSDFSEVSLRRALDQYTSGLAPLSGIDIAWEDVPFTPKAGQTFVAVQLISRVDEPLGKFQGGTIMAEGQYQLNIAIPTGKGPYPGMALIDQLKPFYKRGQTVTTGDGKLVTFGLRQIPKSYGDGAWLRHPFIVPFMLFAQA